MTQQIINTGVAPNDATGDTLQVAFNKCNSNFSDLYASRVVISATQSPYNADPTGANDATAAIQAAINAAAALKGGIVYLPPGTYKIGTAGTGLVINSSNVGLLGAGSSYISNSGTPSSAATTLTWGGSSSTSAVMVACTSPQGATLDAIQGLLVQGITLDCVSACGFGLQITSIKKSNFSQLYVKNPTTAAYQLTTWLNANLVDTDTQHNIFTQCIYRCLDSSAAAKAHGFWLTNALTSSSTNGNTSFNTFIECLGQTNGLATASSGVGIKIDAGDNNSFINCICYRASGTTVPSVQLNGYNSSSDGNVFYHFSDTTAANAININGNATLGSGFNPTQNCFMFPDSNNGVNYPTLDAGCRVFWLDTNGVSQKAIALGMVLGGLSSVTNTLAQVANLTNESLRIYNASSDHIILTDGTHTWGLNIDGSANLRIQSLSGGSGNVSGPSFTANSSVAIPAGGTAGIGYMFSTTAHFGVFFGSGPPTLAAAQGSLYLRSDGSSSSTRAYINTDGSTTWTNLTTAA